MVSLPAGAFADQQKTCSPKLSRVAATHRMSIMMEGSTRAPLSRFPYLIWKGSIMVTYIRSLIGLAKKSPPEADPLISLWSRSKTWDAQQRAASGPVGGHGEAAPGSRAPRRCPEGVLPPPPQLPELLVGEEDAGKLVRSTKEAEFCVSLGFSLKGITVLEQHMGVWSGAGAH